MTKAKKKITKVCEYCGNTFEADKISTKYCSHKCNSAAYKANSREMAVKQNRELLGIKQMSTVDLSNRSHLSIAEVALMIGVSRQTAYNMAYSGKIQAVRITKRLTFVSKKSVDELLEARTSYLKQDRERKPISDWYTLNEITDKFGIRYGQIRKIINSEGIPTKKDGQFTLVAQRPIDTYFKKRGFNDKVQNLLEWITLSGIMEEYGMTEKTAYSFICLHKIPKKQLNGKRFYSKLHIDNLKNKKS